ncbi:MAG TPA: DUF1572 family protein [Gemmatimonadaceae bacterium]|nr:DUF1572 family protein [Gemmatimonadaceae bacterium]
MARDIVGSITAEFRRYKALAEGALRQLRDEDLSRTNSPTDSPVAVIAWHISGNLRSRFTDFLSSDGEKPWRDRESEFKAHEVSRTELLTQWEEGWQVLLGTLDALSDDDLDRFVSIRGVPLRVYEALHRSLAHTSYHVGQIVYVSKMLRGGAWQYLSIPPGGSEEYNKSPAAEKALAHADRITRSAPDGASHRAS